MNRKIPIIMASQHPDNACKPYWHTKPYISDKYEVQECFFAFSKLGISEYKWDWEGKFVDESVFERLIYKYATFFRKHPLGKEKFLTFRLPDFKVNTEFRLGRSLMVLSNAAELADEIGLHSPPLFEVIIPMTQSAKEMIGVQEAFHEIASLKHPFHKKNKGTLKHLEIIPLFEHLSTITESDKIIKQYFFLHKKKYGFTPSYVRPYLARSDSALSSGIVPSVLAIKIALSSYRFLQEATGITSYPIIGPGSLPFRGGSTPYTIPAFADEYKGIKTMLVQSAFQYDFPPEHVTKAIKNIEKLLPKKQAEIINQTEKEKIIQIMTIFQKQYQNTLKGIVPIVHAISKYLPPRRERLNYTGPIQYSRVVNKLKIPRAISFTAAFYSLGIPPEFIGTGRGIKITQKNNTLNFIEKNYTGFKIDLKTAGKYLNRNVLENMAKRSNYWQEILKDVQYAEKYLGHSFSPITEEEKAHKKLTSKIYKGLINNENISQLIQEAAKLRRSLG